MSARPFVSIVIAAGLLVFAAAPSSPARDFRRFEPIGSPAARALPSGVEPFGEPRQVSPAVAEEALARLIEAWNTTQMGDYIGPEFFDRSRFVDTVQTQVPRDAKVRILGIRGVETLTQGIENDPDEGPLLVSIISLTANTQIEFNNVNNGRFLKIPGTVEYLLRIKQSIED